MTIRWDKFTLKAQEAVQRANELASEHGNPELLPLHLLAALLEDKEGMVPPVLEKIGIGPQSVLNELYEAMETLPKVSGGATQASLSTSANQLLDRAFNIEQLFRLSEVRHKHNSFDPRFALQVLGERIQPVAPPCHKDQIVAIACKTARERPGDSGSPWRYS